MREFAFIESLSTLDWAKASNDPSGEREGEE
jgi:hypothetical protein